MPDKNSKKEDLFDAVTPEALELPSETPHLEEEEMANARKNPERKVAWYEPLLAGSMFFALSTRSNIMTPLLLPLLVQSFVGEAQKGTYLGILRLATLMVALMAQAIAGIYSDHSTSNFGRRRPFILVSNILEIIGFIVLGMIATNMSGMTGYWVMLGVVVISMVTSNIGHAAAQGIIPDVAPKSKVPLYSAIKSLLEVPLPIIFVFVVVKGQIEKQNYWGALTILIAVYIVCAILTLFVREKPQAVVKPIDHGAIWRVVGMTTAFALIILILGLLVNAILPLIAGKTTSNLIMMAVLGLTVMLVATVLGVIAGTRISLGREAGQHKSFTWWVINRLAFIVGVTNLSSFMLYFVQERFPAAQGAAAVSPVMMLMGGLAIALLLSSAIAAPVMKAVGTKRLIFICGIMAFIGAGIVVLAPTLMIMIVGGFICGLAMGFFYAANWALGVTLVPQAEAGRYLGLSNLAGAGAGAIGAYLGGPIGDAGGFTLLMGIYGLMFIFSTLALTKINESELVHA